MRKYRDKTNLIIMTIVAISIILSMLILYLLYSYTITKINDTYYKYGAITHAISSICNNSDIHITLIHQDKKYDITLEDININTNIHTIIDSKHQHMLDTSTYESTTNTITKMKESDISYKDILNYIFIGFNTKINKIISDIEYEPIDSTITFNKDSKNLFNITKSASGIKVDTTKLYTSIIENLMNSPNITLEIPTITINPIITEEYNKSLTHKISSFTTNVSDSTGGRKTNVKLALSKVNGLMVKPNESISFNKITGPHTASTGYKPATVILNGEYVEDIGGGICQASSTLYNALLLTGTKITEVAKHSIPVKYVPLALDAMVSEGIADLKWTNTLNHPMFIHTYSDSDSVTVDIYSKPLEDNITYKTRSETLKTIDFDKDTIIKDTEQKYTNHILYEGEYYRLKYPRVGYEAVGYLEKYKDNIKISETKIRHEIYKPQNGVVVEGINTPVSGMTIENSIKIYN